MYNTIITDNTLKSFTNTCNVNYHPYGQGTVQDQGTSDVVNLFADGDANGEQGIKEATEETIENNFEELEEIPDIKMENVGSSVTENHANQTAEKNHVEVNVDPIQEEITDESELLEDIPSIETEKPTVSVTEDSANQTAEKNHVEANVAPVQKDLENKSKNVEKITSVEEEKKSRNKAKAQVTKTNAAISSTNHAEDTQNMKVNALPKTGDSNDLISVISGFFLLIVSLIVFSLRQNRQV